MLTKTNLVSTLVTGLWALFGGYLLWGILGETLLAGHELTLGLMRENPDFIHLSIGCLLAGLAFSVLYGKWANGIYTNASGIIFGAWVAVLIGLGEGLITYSTAELLDLSGTLINFGIYFVFYIIMGMLASLIYRKVSK
ncbi:MAG: hypothetical protein R3213_00970 [Flavobacteriaceae bacterium]|nr:hypothetical protein [Flavobacteriaceae bacterium]